eukprot:scpid77523/ scgid33990/ 
MFSEHTGDIVPDHAALSRQLTMVPVPQCILLTSECRIHSVGQCTRRWTLLGQSPSREDTDHQEPNGNEQSNDRGQVPDVRMGFVHIPTHNDTNSNYCTSQGVYTIRIQAGAHDSLGQADLGHGKRYAQRKADKRHYQDAIAFTRIQTHN